MREWLEALRSSHGMTAEQTSDALGLRTEEYMLIEQGRKCMDWLTAVRTARLFCISVDLIARMESRKV